MVLRGNWWKIGAVALLLYTIIGGMMMDVPKRFILHETIRNLYFHVPMWFCMIVLFFIALYYSIRHLAQPQVSNLHTHEELARRREFYDTAASQFVHTGLLFGIMGLVTGMIWAQYTWGQWWSGDPKQNATAILLLLYIAYFVLRSSIGDEQTKAKVAAVYNIFAAASIIPLLFILPRMTDSLHPGNGGNPGFNKYDLDSHMRLVFYPAVIGWILLGIWIAQLRTRSKKLENEILETI